MNLDTELWDIGNCIKNESIHDTKYKSFENSPKTSQEEIEENLNDKSTERLPDYEEESTQTNSGNESEKRVTKSYISNKVQTPNLNIAITHKIRPNRPKSLGSKSIVAESNYASSCQQAFLKQKLDLLVASKRNDTQVT